MGGTPLPLSWVGTVGGGGRGTAEMLTPVTWEVSRWDVYLPPGFLPGCVHRPLWLSGALRAPPRKHVFKCVNHSAWIGKEAQDTETRSPKWCLSQVDTPVLLF